jgi:hypothetical protein
MATDRTEHGATRGAGKPSSDVPRVVYTPHPEVTPEDEQRVLASVYGFVLQCLERNQKVAEAGDDTKTEGGHVGGWTG